MKLNVGCGRNILLGWTNLDCVSTEGVDVVADLEQCATVPLPFETNTVDEILLSHVIEHIKSPLPMMQELWRISKEGGKLTIRVPHGASDDAWEDPTHVRAYFTNSFQYFSQPLYCQADYGYRGDWKLENLTFCLRGTENFGLTVPQVFEIINTQRNVVREMVAEFTAVKPIREPLIELQTIPKIHFQYDQG